MPNAVLAYEVLDHIEAHPETWNQKEWWCGTGGCFGGWAVQLSVGVGNRTEVFTTAMAVLGIARTPCNCGIQGCGAYSEPELFNADNTLDDLKNIVLDYFGPRLVAEVAPAEPERQRGGGVSNDCDKG